jgi:quercetin dioxygenase-like cupin family protein
MTRILVPALAVLLALCGRVAAQERLVFKQLLDNERVRVSQGTFKPGDKTASRPYPNHLFYTLTEGTLVFVPEGRTGYEVNFKAGEAMWFPPLARATENDSDKEVRVLLVEFKDGGGARVAKARATGKGKARARLRIAKPKAAAPRGAAPRGAGKKQ